MLTPRSLFSRLARSSASAWLLVAMGTLAAHGAALAQDAPEEAAEKIDLRPHYAQGHKSRFEFWTSRKQKASISAGERSQTVEALYTFEGEITWEVQSVHEDGSATCAMTLDWLSVKAEAGGRTQVSDSRQNAGDSEGMHRLITAMAGVPLTCEMAADGSVKSVTGLDAIAARGGDDLNLPEEKDYEESASDLATIPFAPVALELAGQWSAQFDWTHEIGAMTHDTTFTVASTEAIADIPIATVTFDSNLTLKPDMSQIPAGSPPVDIRMTQGKASGQIMFDLQRHEAVGRNTMQETTIVTTINLPQGQVVRSLTETTQSQCLRIEEVGP